MWKLTSIQLAGVAPEVNLRNSIQARKCASEKSILALKFWQTSPEVQNRGINSPTKRTYILQNFFKKTVWKLSCYIRTRKGADTYCSPLFWSSPCSCISSGVTCSNSPCYILTLIHFCCYKHTSPFGLKG